MNNNWFLINLSSWSIMTLIIISIIVKILHPIIIILLMLIYISLVSLNMALWNMNFIFPIMLFMMMISGLLVIFLYFSSLISNAKPFYPNNLTLIIFLTVSLSLMPWFIHKKSNQHSPMNSDLFPMPTNHTFLNSQSNWSSTEPLFTPHTSNMTLICIMILMLTMIMITKICSPKSKSLRKLHH